MRGPEGGEMGVITAGATETVLVESLCRKNLHQILRILGGPAQTPNVAVERRPVGEKQSMLMIGAGLVLFGFFLPWFSYNPGKELNRMSGQMQGMMNTFSTNLPHVATTMDAATRRMISFIALGIGGIMLVWLISQNLRFINVGVVLVLAGYVIEFLGLLGPRSHGVLSSSAATGRV